MAYLQVDSTPPGASIVLGDRFEGHTPSRFSIVPGVQTVSLSLDGYSAYSTAIDVACDDTYILTPVLYDVQPPTITMEPLPKTVVPTAGLKIIASAQDNESVAAMALYVNDLLFHEVEGASLRHNMDTLALDPGPHKGRIVARDRSGNESIAHFDFQIVSLTVIPVASSTSEATFTVLPHPDPTPIPNPSMIATVPAPMVVPTVTPTPVPDVTVHSGQVTLAMYDYERALYTDPGVGHPYPLLRQEEVGPPISRTFETIVMRNAYLELIILPDLGGRIYQCRFLPTGQPLLYNSRIAKPTHWGPEDQGWWLALGGIEFALPVDEHGYLWAQPWEATVSRHSDGSATVSLHIVEQTRQLDTRVEITLYPREAAIRMHTSLHNVSDQTQAFQYWVNAMLSPGRHGVGPDLRFSYPADRVVVHSRGDINLPPDGQTMSWPRYGGRDLSRYGAWVNWLGFFAPELSAPFTAVYDEATQIGLVHVFPPQLMRGSKLFGFGRDFDNSTFADDGAQYVEMWSGLTPTFWEDISLPADGRLAWDDIWYVVAQSGGVHFANEHASLYAWRDGKDFYVTVAAFGEHHWRLALSQQGQMLDEQSITVRPDAPYTATFSLADGNMGDAVTVHILDANDTIVLEHEFK